MIHVLMILTTMTVGNILVTGAIYIKQRHRIRRLHDRQLHMQRMLGSMSRDIQFLQQAEQQHTQAMQARETLERIPSPRKSAGAHHRAIVQGQLEASARRRTVDLSEYPTQEI